MELDNGVFLSTIGSELVDLSNRLENAQNSGVWSEVGSVTIAIARMSIRVIAEAKQLNGRERIILSDKDPGVRVSIR